jgi:hypothetical protein
MEVGHHQEQLQIPGNAMIDLMYIFLLPEIQPMQQNISSIMS